MLNVHAPDKIVSDHHDGVIVVHADRFDITVVLQ